MFCSNCGKEIKDHAKFCAYCGSPVQGAPASPPPTPEISSPPIPPNTKKSVSPVLIGVIAAVVLVVAAVAGGAYYITTRDNTETEETSASSEIKDKDKETSKKETNKPETEEKEKAPAAPKTAGLLQDYLDTELIPQYGTANLEGQIREFYNDDLYAEGSDHQFWTGSAGLSDATIYDLDQDGDEELLVFLLTDEDITLCIYDTLEGEVNQTAEFTQPRYSDMEGFDISWSLLTADETPYLFCHEEGYGITCDFSTTNTGLYRYDGTQLYSPLVIAQTGGGSSDFVYTAYQYNSDGELLEEEVVYDETEEYLSADQPKYYYQRVSELFDAYGIHLDSEASVQRNQNLYHNISEADGYTPLLHLEMYGEHRYQNDSYGVIYHFNDFDSPWAFYKGFLSGEETVQMRKDAWYYGDLQEEWTLADILAEIENEYGTYPSIQYTYLDCGGDGAEELAVRFVGLDTYDQNDDSNLTMIITCNGKSPEVVYSGESWARSGTTPLYHGCISSYGSNGAGDHSGDVKYLDADANLHTVYEVRLLGGPWIRDLNPDAYDAAFASEGPDASVTYCQIKDEEYYIIESYDTSVDSQCQEYVSLCGQSGMHFISEDEIDELIDQRLEELGIAHDWLEEEEPSWNYWWG